jgi:hypothetical protein
MSTKASPVRLPPIAVWIPTGRAINPSTKINWEGVGVKPDDEVSADSALEKAKALATQEIAKLTNAARCAGAQIPSCLWPIIILVCGSAHCGACDFVMENPEKSAVSIFAKE